MHYTHITEKCKRDRWIFLTKAEKAAAWAESMAADNSHGYDQGNRWGPDYDCSSLVILSYENAGVPVKSRGAVYTGNMRGVFLSCGFRDVTGAVTLPSGAGLRRGDVLLNVRHHTAMYLGGGRIVHAAGNEWGGAAGGRTGDQTGREIASAAYFNFPWDCVLRYEEEAGEGEPSTAGTAGASPAEGGGGVYVVRSGDSLWAIAERLLGSGFRYPELMELNGLGDAVIRPGMELRIPAGSAPAPETEAPARAECAVTLPVLAEGDVGGAVRSAQTLLCLRGGSLPVHGADGEFGPETARAVRAFRAGALLGESAAVDAPVWRALVTGERH